jgi:tetratricopeptide (TPR) repeat protein
LHSQRERGHAAGELREKAMVARQNGNLSESLAQFEALAKVSPADPEPVYEAACDADGLGDYNRAREGYLAALRLDRKHANARLKLVLLTARAGAAGEAAHHFEELSFVVAAKDARLAVARAALAQGGR